MSFIGSLFSGSRGAGYQPEQATGIQNAQELYLKQMERLQQQENFARALGAQSPQAIQQQMMLGKELAGAVRGQGPSVAQSQLDETTRQNIQRQAALMQSQRGASANLGLLQRNVASTGADIQQQAAGQAATLRAQEMLAARQQLAGLTGQQLGQISEAQKMGILGTSGAYQTEQQAIAERNRINAQIAAGNQQFQTGLVGGLIGGATTALKGMAEGGEVQNDDDEDLDNFYTSFSRAMTAPQPNQSQNYQSGQMAGQGAGQAIGKTLSGLFKKGPSGQTTGGYAGANLGVQTAMPQMVNPMANAANIGALNLGFSQGGKVPAMVSPGEKYLPPGEVKKVASGQKSPLSAGKTIPGKAKVKGDSYENDTVKATLQEGGIVIPRSVMQSENPAEKARQFVAAVLAKKQAKR